MDDVVVRLRRGKSGLAVAVNDEVVPRSRWASTALQAGDRVEVLTGHREVETDDPFALLWSRSARG